MEVSKNTNLAGVSEIKNVVGREIKKGCVLEINNEKPSCA